MRVALKRRLNAAPREPRTNLELRIVTRFRSSRKTVELWTDVTVRQWAGNGLWVRRYVRWHCPRRRRRCYRFGLGLGGAVHRHFVEIRIACWRQFHAMRAQAFNHVTVFDGDPTAKPLHIRTARSSQGEAGRCWGCILRIFRRWGPSGSRSPRYRGGSSNGWRRRRLWDHLNENFLVGGL